MADVRKTIEILFRGVDQTSNVVQDISGNIDSFASNVGKLSGPLADLANKALLTEGAVLGLAGAFVGVAYHATEQFESAQLDLQKVMTDTEGNVDDYNEEIFRLSSTYGRLAGEVLGGVTNFKLAGFTMEESVGLMEESTKLLIAGDIDAAQATEILVATLKGFKAPASEAARITDILNEVSNRYATNVQELGIGMAHLSPIASLMGFSFEETAGILTPVIEIFRSGSEASNALKVGLLKLLDDAKPVRDALANLGVAQYDANGHLRSGRDILFDVGNAFQYANENDKLFLASQLVGVRQAGRMIEVFNGLSKSTEITAVALGAAGSAMKEVNIRLSSIEVAGDRAAVAFNNLLIAVGESMKEDLTSMINSFTELGIAITGAINEGKFDNLIGIIIPIVNDIENLFLNMAENIGDVLSNIDYDNLAAAIGNLRNEVIEAFQAIFGDIDLNTAQGLEDFIQKLIDGFTALTRITTEIIDIWQPLLEMLGRGIDTFVESDKEVQDFAGTILGLGQIVDKIVKNIDIFTGSLNLLGISLSVIATGKISSAVINNFSSIATAATKAGTATTLLAGAGASFGTGWMVGSTLRLAFPVIDEWTQKMWAGIDSVVNFTGTQGEQQESLEETKARLQENLEKVEEYRKKIEEADGGKIETIIEVVATGADAEIVKGMLDGSIDRETGLPSWAAGLEVPWVFKPEVKDEDIEQFKKKVGTDILEWWDEKGEYHTMVVDADTSKAKEELESIPTEKEVLLRIDREYDLALEKIKQDSEIIQAQMEFEAKLNIAQIEGQVEIIKAAFDSVNVGIESTGELIGNMLGIWSNASLSDKYDLERMIEREYDLREREFDLQEKLANSKIQLESAKEKFFLGEGGEAIITIETSEVYPELDMVMLELIKRAQVKATALGLATLLGVQEA